MTPVGGKGANKCTPQRVAAAAGHMTTGGGWGTTTSSPRGAAADVARSTSGVGEGVKNGCLRRELSTVGCLTGVDVGGGKPHISRRTPVTAGCPSSGDGGREDGSSPLRPATKCWCRRSTATGPHCLRRRRGDINTHTPPHARHRRLHDPRWR